MSRHGRSRRWHGTAAAVAAVSAVAVLLSASVSSAQQVSRPPTSEGASYDGLDAAAAAQSETRRR